MKIPANSYLAVEEFYEQQRDLEELKTPALLNQRLVDKAKLVVQGLLVEIPDE
jgi:hypothetical protein